MNPKRSFVWSIQLILSLQKNQTKVSISRRLSLESKRLYLHWSPSPFSVRTGALFGPPGHWVIVQLQPGQSPKDLNLLGFSLVIRNNRRFFLLKWWKLIASSAMAADATRQLFEKHFWVRNGCPALWIFVLPVNWKNKGEKCFDTLITSMNLLCVRVLLLARENTK